MRRRVVITGLGPVSAVGLGVDAFWSALLEGRSGLRPIESLDPGGFKCRVGGEVRDLSAKDYVPKGYRKQTKVMARDTELAVACAKLAADDAGLVTRGSEEGDAGFAISPERTGCQIGAGLIAAETEELSRALVTSLDETGEWDVRKWGTAEGGEGGMNNLPPLWMLKYLPNMLACHVTIIHGAEGPSNTILAAEASALLCVGEGARVVERGDADLSFVGGAESKLNQMGILRTDLLGRLADSGDETDGSRVVRPFDAGASGTVLGEGGGIAIIEELGHARARGARVYAEIAGFGASQSSLDATPEQSALGAAVRAALRDAEMTADEIDAIVPLGIGVVHSDASEAAGLREVFGARLGSIPMITVSPMTGNAVAGHGGLTLAAGALAVHHQTLPARIHAGTPMSGVDAGAARSRDAKLGAVLVCTTALGGQNAAVVLRRAS
ncbi:MAG: beta-ketoacyl synthase N-terminal-like domain-containing protein [Phycisphaerales bacterium]